MVHCFLYAVFKIEPKLYEIRKGVLLMPDNQPLQAFVHIATSANTRFNYTYIDNELTNNKPDALVFVTQRWYPEEGSQRGIYNDHPIGVWYDNDKWSIYNQRKPRDPQKPDQRSEIPAMHIGAAFNVWVYQDIPLHSANKPNDGQLTLVDSTPLVKRAQVSKSRLFIILFYIIVPLLMLWLLGGVVLYFQRNVNMAHLQNMFMLWDYPFVSFGLLLLGLVVFLMFIDDHWRKLFAWLGSLDHAQSSVTGDYLAIYHFFCDAACYGDDIPRYDRVFFQE